MYSSIISYLLVPLVAGLWLTDQKVVPAVVAFLAGLVASFLVDRFLLYWGSKQQKQQSLLINAVAAVVGLLAVLLLPISGLVAYGVMYLLALFFNLVVIRPHQENVTTTRRH